MMKKSLIIIAAAALMTACGTTNQTAKQTAITTGSSSAQQRQTPIVQTTPAEGKEALNYVRKVNDNAVYTKNIVSKVDVTVNAGGKDISVGGKLYMRKNEVVRIQLTPFGLMEVGRLEFTPDYVLLINRLENEYVKATYNEVDFLKANGLDFYTLQSLFWNELFQPGKRTLTDSDLSLFNTNMAQTTNRHLTLTSGKLNIDWTTDAARAEITEALITYAKGTAQASTVVTEYGDFMPVGSKRFPTKQKVTFSSKQFSGGKMSMQLLLNKITNDEKWEARTTVSEKYKKITAQQFFNKLAGM